MGNSIKIRAKQKGKITTVKGLITHPMETGNRKDSKTGKKIPAHFIQDVGFSFVKVKAKVVHSDDPHGDDTLEYTMAGEPEGEVMQAQLSGGVSKNPYISVKLIGRIMSDLIQSETEEIPIESAEGSRAKKQKKITLTKDEGYGVVLSWSDNKGGSDSNFAPIK